MVTVLNYTNTNNNIYGIATPGITASAILLTVMVQLQY
jgi:hypothetical protein